MNITIEFRTFELGEGNLIFCYTGPTDPSFWQIKVMIVISHINIFLFTIYFSSNMIFFFLVVIKQIKKQKFSALHIVESQGKEMWSLL